jgi:hypothetical protein
VSSDEIARIRRDADSALWGLFAEVRELPDVDEWQENARERAGGLRLLLV